jgi:hypothetical protein
MPHIILSGTPDLWNVHKAFAAFRADSNGWIIKVQHCMISENAKTLVFDCTAVRSGFSQDFYIRAESKEERVSVRVDPYMRIERNEGVQRAIVAITKLIKQHCPELGFSKTNLPEDVLPADGAEL